MHGRNEWIRTIKARYMKPSCTLYALRCVQYCDSPDTGFYLSHPANESNVASRFWRPGSSQKARQIIWYPMEELNFLTNVRSVRSDPSDGAY